MSNGAPATAIAVAPKAAVADNTEVAAAEEEEEEDDDDDDND